MSEAEWRGIGVQQSRGWIHYMCHRPGTLRDPFLPQKVPQKEHSAPTHMYVSPIAEPHVLLFRRPTSQ